MEITKAYEVAVLLTNCRSCVSGKNQVSKYFRCKPPTLDEYLDMGSGCAYSGLFSLFCFSPLQATSIFIASSISRCQLLMGSKRSTALHGDDDG
jgi:hypothetical protein